MKYIRTKDAIYDTYSKNIQLSKEKITNEIEYYYQSNAYSIPFKLNVIAQANTIEELCDIFVIWTKDFGLKNPIQFNNPIQTNRYINLKINKGHIGDVYGAIWTNKGLIYVAKMNDKGELELL